MANFDRIADDLEHFAAVINTQAHRGYAINDGEILAKLSEAVRLLDEVSEDLCNAQEEDEARQDTEADLNRWLNGDAVRASLASLSVYKR